MKTAIGYKLFRVSKKYPGKLFLLYVNANTNIPIGEWIIAGEMKVIKILSDQEVKEICDSCGSDYLPRKETINLSEFGFAA